MNRFVLLILMLFPALYKGCMKDDMLWDFKRPSYDVSHQGLFIINEGNFMYGNASLSYYDPDRNEVYNEVFYNTNALPLGDVAFSMTIRDSLGYVVVNNSGRIYVINTRTFAYLGKITGLTSPRYMHFVSDTKAYVTDLYARSIAVVNPQSLEITGSIPVSNHEASFYQHATEQMIGYERYVYTNCWSYDNKILVIDSEEDRVVDSIEVLKQPNSMAMDRYHTLWVLSDGGYPESPYGYEIPGLMKIEAGAKEAVIAFRFSVGDRPVDLTVNGRGDTLYFINRHVYRYAIGSPSPPELFISSPYDRSTGGYYGLEVDQVTSEIYVANAIDHVQRGMVYRFSPSGTVKDTFPTGISPGAFCFKPF